MKRQRRPHLIVGWSLLAALAATGAIAQAPTPKPTPFVYVPVRMEGRPITLEEAVRIALANDPDVMQSEQTVLIAQGALQEEQGAFDPTVVFTPSYVHSEGELVGGAFLAEENRRKTHRILAEVFQQTADDLEAQLAENDLDRLLFACDELIGAGNTVVIDGRDVCAGFRTGFTPDDELFFNILNAAANLPPSHPLAGIFTQLREDILNSLRADIQQLIHTFNGLARDQRESLRRLGIIPDVFVRDELTLDLRYRIPFRQGFAVAPTLFLQGTRDGFRNKPHNPVFGGSTIPTLFRSVIGVTFDAPLLRGFGRISAQAPERIAEFNLNAAELQADHRKAESALRTTLAYWNLVAAQERLGLLERSAASQQRILDITGALVEADEVPRAELDRTRARVSDAQGSVARQRQSVIRARVALADAMGLDIDDLDAAPLAAEGLPAPDGSLLPAEDQLDEFARAAVERRVDVKAAREREQASVTLMRAARAELKPRLDLAFILGYGGIAESFLDDIYEPAGYQEAFEELWGPSFSILLSWEVPIGNNRQKGLLLRADALREQSEVQAGNLERVVASNVTEIVMTARRTLTELERRRASAGYYEETVTAAFEQFRGGELNLLDAILTEERETFALLDLVTARQTLATLMSRLKFESGTLLAQTGPNQFSLDLTGIAPTTR